MGIDFLLASRHNGNDSKKASANDTVKGSQHPIQKCRSCVRPETMRGCKGSVQPYLPFLHPFLDIHCDVLPFPVELHVWALFAGLQY
jgi:hypothetical protein